MEANLYDEAVDRFGSMLEEGKVYDLLNVEVEHITADYKTVKRAEECKITKYSKVEEIIDECSDIPKFAFEFVEFNDLLRLVNKRSWLIGKYSYINQQFQCNLLQLIQ